MDSNSIGTVGGVLSVVDLMAIIAVFAYFNNRIGKLEKNGSSTSSTSSTSFKGGNGVMTTNEKDENRITCLENEIEILLDRLEAYDKIFAKLMHSVKELSMHDHNQVMTDFKPYRSSIRRRNNTLISGVPSNPEVVEITPAEDVDSDDEMFSFLKN